MIRAVFYAGIAAIVAVTATAETSRYGGFRHDDALPHILSYRGEIDRTTLRHFRQAMRNHNPTILLLDSPGGRIYAALALARQIRENDLATVIPPGAECASACAFLFAAGTRRQAEGRLGVHRFSSELKRLEDMSETEGETQQVVARIIDTLADHGVTPNVLVRMFETSHDDMYWFSPSELKREKLITDDRFQDDLEKWAALNPLDWRGPDAQLPAEAIPRKERDDLSGLPEIGPPQIGPGFDCTLSDSPTETLICRNARLAALDLALAKRLDRLASRMEISDAIRLRFDQMVWTTKRNDCETDTACLQDIYFERLDRLGY